MPRYDRVLDIALPLPEAITEQDMQQQRQFLRRCWNCESTAHELNNCPKVLILFS